MNELDPQVLQALRQIQAMEDQRRLLEQMEKMRQQSQQRQQSGMPNMNMLDKFMGGGGSAGGSAAYGSGITGTATGAGAGSLYANAGGANLLPFNAANYSGLSGAGITGGSAGGSVGGAGITGGSAGGSVGSGGGLSSIGGGGLMSNPYAWIAALAIGNEWNGSKTGRRDSEPIKHFQDLVTGGAMIQDKEYIGKKLFGSDKYGFGADTVLAGKLGNPLARDGLLGDPSGTWDTVKDTSLGKLLRKIF